MILLQSKTLQEGEEYKLLLSDVWTVFVHDIRDEVVHLLGQDRKE